MVLPVVPLLSGPWSQRCSRQSRASFAVTQPHGSERPSDVTEVDATTAGWESQNPWALVRVCLEVDATTEAWQSQNPWPLVRVLGLRSTHGILSQNMRWRWIRRRMGSTCGQVAE